MGLELRKAVFAIAGAVRPKCSQIKERDAKVVCGKMKGRRECDLGIGMRFSVRRLGIARQSLTKSVGTCSLAVESCNVDELQS